MKKNTFGFTLIELLIVITILAILGAIAIPAYSSYAEKARRSDGRAALTSVSLAQERFFTVNGAYAFDDQLSDLDLTASNVTVNDDDPDSVTSEAGNYLITIDITSSSSTYTLTATAQASQAGDDNCLTMTLTNTGIKSGTAAAGEDLKCW